MNSIRLITLAVCCACQPFFEASSALADNPPGTNTYAVVARMANARVWAKDVSVTNAQGQTVVRRKSYTEVSANACFQDANGNWMDSDPALVPVANGASSGNTPLAVHFSGDAAAAGGTVSLTDPDGKSFVSQVFGISYYDPTVPTNLLIAPLQSVQGTMVGNNHILYQNAFSGLNADLWYTYTLSGLSQDIVLHECPPSPTNYGLNPQTTMVQIVTEWFNPPEPRHITGTDDGIEHDAYLDFGNMIMGPGAALFTQGQADPVPVESGSIYKHWTQINGRNWLIEEIRYPAIAGLLQTLPLHAAADMPKRGNIYERIASSAPLHPVIGGDYAGQRMQIAKAVPHAPGLILDYNIVSSVANFTFQNDTTYYITNSITMSGTNTTFEGGTVLKYNTNVTLTVSSPVTWLTTNYLPVILTAQDDDRVGDVLDVSTGVPGTNYYADTALFFNATNAGTNIVLRHLRVMNATTAVAINGQSNHIFGDVQMVNCRNGLAATNASYSLWNALMYKVMTNFNGTNSTGDVEHLTIDNDNALFVNQTLNLTNCLLAVVGSMGSFTSNDVFTSSTTNVFQTVGSGSHYLATNSSYVNAGTTNIAPSLAADLRQMTTYPPLSVGGFISNDTTFSAVVQRDTDIPDIGYHYDPIDFAGAYAIENSAVTILPGTTFAKNGNYCFSPDQASTLQCNGTVTSPIYFVNYALVQEQSNNKWPIGGGGNPQPSFITSFEGSNTVSVGNFRFTYWMVPAGDIQIEGWYFDASSLIGMQDCQLFGGSFTSQGTTILITNCLFDRVTVTMVDVGGINVSNLFRNNLLLGGSLYVGQGLTGPWTFQDNLFDRTTISSMPPTNDIFGYNSYITTNYGTLTVPTNATDLVLTTSPAYQVAALGRNYYPTNLSLIYKGSDFASNLGLYHYTMTTNNVIEGTNMVSIGFHYVAVGSNGLPLDGDGDGIPDYIEDANGDGSTGGDASSWLSATTCPSGPGDYLMSLLGYNFASCNSTNDIRGLIGLTTYTPMQ